MSTNRTNSMRQMSRRQKCMLSRRSTIDIGGFAPKFSPNLVGDDSKSSSIGPTGEKMNASPVGKVSNTNGMYEHRRGGDGGI